MALSLVRPAPAAEAPADALERAVRRHLRGTWRYLRALGCPAGLAEDLTQEAFVIAWQKGAQARPEPALGAFLRRTAAHLWLRSRKARPVGVHLVETLDRLWQQQCAGDGGEGLLSALRACKDELRGRPARVLELVYGQGKSRAEAAARLGMKETGVKTLLQRTRAALRECLARAGYGRPADAPQKTRSERP